jgi:hypothetical protein
MRRSIVTLAATFSLVSAVATAQTTGTTAFSAPYRAFETHEFGGTLSFPGGNDGLAAEGMYGFGKGKFDIGLRGGIVKYDNVDAQFLVGVSARQRVLEHSEQFPLDGAIVFGAGAQFGDATQLYVPAGLSLGRRLDVEDSDVSIVPYIQPTVFFTEGSNQDLDVHFTIGIGGDFRLSRMFDARVSVGLGDMEGISISAVWLR